MSKVLIIPNTGSSFASVAVDTVTPIEGDVAIIVAASPEGGGTVTGTGGYAEGAEVTISATPSLGYEFVQWNDGNTNATRIITVGSTSATYTATFALRDKALLIGYGYKGNTTAGVRVDSGTSIYVAVNPANVDSQKSIVIDGITYSAIYIPSGKTTLSYSENSSYKAIGGINDGSSPGITFEPSEGWTQSNSFSISQYVGMYVTFSIRKVDGTIFSSADTEESIGLNFSLT